MNLPKARAALDVLATHAPGTWLIALSGGLDSRVLLDLCVAHRRAHPLAPRHLITAHVHHHLRASADLDAAFCDTLCASLPEVTAHHTLHLDPSHWQGSTQQAARRARYEALTRLAAQCEASAILTAHHLDDALETFVMHAARGSGSRGLSSLARRVVSPPPHAAPELPAHVSLHRPLITCTRHAIEHHALESGLKWIEDPTNNLDTYTRNVVRHDLLPRMEDVHGNGSKGWARTLSHLLEEADFLEHTVESLWQRATSKDWPLEGALHISTDALRTTHPYLLKRLLLRAHHEVVRARAPDESKLLTLGDMCLATPRAPDTLALPGARAERDMDGVVLLPTPRRGSRGWFDEPAAPVELDVREGRGRFEWYQGELLWSTREAPARPEEASTCLLSLRPGDTVKIRGALPGERAGMTRTEPIREILRRRGVPAWRRHLWPVLVVTRQGEVAQTFVLGEQRGHEEAREGISLHLCFVESSPHRRSS